jgi:hypothetical protein
MSEKRGPQATPFLVASSKYQVARLWKNRGKNQDGFKINEIVAIF